VNETQPGRVVALAEGALGGSVSGRRVAVLGVAFKAGTDDLRMSPGLVIVDELLARGAEVVVFDPLVGEALLGPQVSRGVSVADSAAEAMAKADAAIVTTIDPAFAGLLDDVEGGPVVVDGRGVLDRSLIDGRQVLAVGRGTPTSR
jgi:UDPglucose 6-dehydrogenase